MEPNIGTTVTLLGLRSPCRSFRRRGHIYQCMKPRSSSFLVKSLTVEGMNVDEVRYTLEN